MHTCTNTTTCPFFNDGVGYSPALNDTMKKRFCLCNNPECARRKAIEAIGREAVPLDLLPTDYERLDILLHA